MSRLEKIETEVEGLSPNELVAFRERFAKFDGENWDRQFEADVAAGNLDRLGERALRDHASGRSTKL